MTHCNKFVTSNVQVRDKINEQRFDVSPGGGGGLPHERDGDARRKIIIKTPKETNLGVAQA